MSNPFDLGGLGGLLGGFQQKMATMKQRQAETVVTGSAGGLVTIEATCDHQITTVSISPDAAADVEMLEDLVRAAANEVLRKIQEEQASAMQELTAGLPIPPGMIPGL